MKTAFIVFIFAAVCLGQGITLKEFTGKYVDTNNRVTSRALKNMAFDKEPIGMTPDQVVLKYGKCTSIDVKKTKKGYRVTAMAYYKVAVDTMPNKKKFLYRKSYYSNARLFFVNDTCNNIYTAIF